MLTNKWILFSMQLGIALLSYFSTVDWNTLTPSKAGAIIAAIAVISAALHAAMPPNDQNDIVKTDKFFFTHT